MRGNSMQKGKTATVVLLALVLVAPLGYSVLQYLSALSPKDPQPLLEKPDPKYESCVRDTNYMRFRHMELLNEIREQAVRHGQRDFRLDNCRGCHPSKERFCNRCHEAVNVHLDCFGCHYYPEVDPAM